MIFVLPIFILGGFILIAIWWFFFRVTVRHENAIRAAKEREANFDRLLLTPDEALYCLECRNIFRGPLEEEGCPYCHIRAFVIPVRAHSNPSIALANSSEKKAPTATPGTVVPLDPDEARRSQQQRKL